MQHQYQINGQELLYHMPKEVDHHVAGEMRQFLEQLIVGGQVHRLCLDFAETEFMDSAGIGMIIGRSKTLGYLGGEVTVIHVSDRIDRIMRTTGLYRMVKKGEE